MQTTKEIKMMCLELVYYYQKHLYPSSAIDQARRLLEWVCEEDCHVGGGEVVSKLDLIIKQNTFIMNKQEKFDSLMGRLNTVTNGLADSVVDIGEDYQKLLAEVKAGTVSDASLEAAEANVAKVENIATQLKALGAQVENPVPESPAGEEPAEEED